MLIATACDASISVDLLWLWLIYLVKYPNLPSHCLCVSFGTFVASHCIATHSVYTHSHLLCVYLANGSSYLVLGLADFDKRLTELAPGLADA